MRAYASLGEIYSRAQQTDQAVLHFRKALQKEPQNVRVRLALGETLFRAKRPKEALAEAQAVRATDPKNRFALELAGRAHRELKEFDEAILCADKVLAQDPTDLKALYLKVTIAEARRDYASAATLLETILARNKRGEDAAESANNDRVFLVHLGFAYQQQAKFAEAANAFGRAKALAGRRRCRAARLRGGGPLPLEGLRSRPPRDTVGPRALPRRPGPRGPGGGHPAQPGRHERRPWPWSTPCARRPPRTRACWPRSRSSTSGRSAIPTPRTRCARWREIKPKDVATLFQLGAVLERQKRHDEAEAAFRDALRVDPDSAPVLNYLGYMNVDRGVRIEESARYIERAVAQDPENGAYLDSLGWAQFKLGHLELAEQNVRKALLKQANNAVVIDHLADILVRRGRSAEALDLWKKALTAEDEEGELDRGPRRGEDPRRPDRAGQEPLTARFRPGAEEVSSRGVPRGSPRPSLRRGSGASASSSSLPAAPRGPRLPRALPSGPGPRPPTARACASP